MRPRSVGLGLVAALALFLAAVAGASAEAPEFGRCTKVAKGTGKFGSSTCTVEKAGASFEWAPGTGANNKFAIAHQGTALTLIDGVYGAKIICSGETGTGEYTGAKTLGHVLITFTGCESSGCAANTAGQPGGVVLLKPLEGVLGITHKGETTKQDKVGLELFPEAEGPVSEFECGPLAKVVLKGSVIEPVTANKMLLSALEKFTELRGEQKPDQFAGEGVDADILEDNVNGGVFGETGIALEATRTNEEAIEVSSVL